MQGLWQVRARLCCAWHRTNFLRRSGENYPSNACPCQSPARHALELSWKLKVDTAEAQGVGDHRYGTEAHGGGGEDGAEQQTEKWIENSGRNGNADRVVGECEEQILADVAHGGLAQVAGAQDCGKVAFYERDAGTFHGDVGAGAHGDTDIGLRQRGGVVDAVTGHRDDSSLPLQLADDLQLPFRQDFGFEFINAKLLSNRRRGGAIVAGEHHDVNALSFEAADGVGSGRLNLIGHGEVARVSAVDGDAKAGAGGRIGRVKVRISAVEGFHVRHQGGIADGDSLAIDHSRDSLSRDTDELTW